MHARVLFIPPAGRPLIYTWWTNKLFPPSERKNNRTPTHHYYYLVRGWLMYIIELLLLEYDNDTLTKRETIKPFSY
jgi:hypothetical protein